MISQELQGVKSLQFENKLLGWFKPKKAGDKNHGTIEFSTELNVYNRIKNKNKLDNMIVIFIDTNYWKTDNDTLVKFRKTLKDSLMRSAVGEKTGVYFQSIPDYNTLKGLSKTTDNEPQRHYHLTALLHCDSLNLIDIKKSFKRKYKNRDFEIRKVVLASDTVTGQSEFYFLDRSSRNGCLQDEKMAFLEALLCLWDEGIYQERVQKIKSDSINNLENLLQKQRIEYSNLLKDMSALKEKTKWEIGPLAMVLKGWSSKAILADRTNSKLNQTAIGTGVSLAYQFDRFRLHMDFLYFNGHMNSRDTSSWTVEEAAEAYVKTTEIIGYRENIDLNGVYLATSGEYSLFKNSPKKALDFAVSAGLGIFIPTQARFYADLEQWNATRYYENMNIQVSDIPELGLYSGKRNGISGKIDLNRAFNLPLGFAFSNEIGKRWTLRIEAQKIFSLNDFSSSSSTSFSNFNETMSAYSFLPFYSWGLSLGIKYKI